MHCQDCDKEMTGDGYNSVLICPDADDLCYEPDAGPVYCGGEYENETNDL